MKLFSGRLPLLRGGALYLYKLVGSFTLLSLAFAFTLFTSCSRKPPLDPNFLKGEAGKAANDFYRSLNNGFFNEAGLYFSTPLRQKYPDPLTYPLVEELRSGKVDQLFPGEGEVNLDDRSVIFEVAVQKGLVSPGSPPILITLRRERHRWIWENDNWYFDGVLKP